MQRLRATLGPDVYDTEAVRGAGMSSDDVLRFLSDTVDNLPQTPRD
jgi:hypothetical protein